ncbi:MAG TPA: hypothetical protein VM532_17305 [Burkholderiales bacterium]|nr:hypothetical protein [Burkholderiales bacterium]
MRNATTLALELFRFLDEQSIAYCVVGDSRTFPHQINSDIDIVIDQRALPTLPEKMLRFCATHDIKLVQCLQHEHNARYFVLSWLDAHGNPAFLIPDICGDYYRRGRLFLNAEELLAGRVAALDDQGRPKGFFVASPAMEFIYYLLKRIDKQSLDDYQGSHLSAQWRMDPIGAVMQVQRYWIAGAGAGVLARAAEADNWKVVRETLPWLRLSIHKHLPFSIKAWAAETWRKVNRVMQPSGLVVAFVGPDGSGKSSVIEACGRVTAPAFRRVSVMHLRPRMGSSGTAKAVSNPHGEAPRGQLASLMKIFYFALDYAAGYGWKVRPLLVRSTLILFDRYYHDMLVDPLRYRYGGSMQLARLARRLIPPPDLWIVMDAPADVLQARKREVSPEESARQREAYLHFFENEKNVVVLDASQPLSQVVSKGSAAILNRLAQRTTHRLGGASVSDPIGARILLFFCRHPLPVLSRMVRIVFNSDIYCKLPHSISVPHPYGIVVHSKAVIGERVTIMQQVTVGGKDLEQNVAPVIGDDVYIGAGAKVLGGIKIGAGAVIGANAVVTRDVPANATVVGANRILEQQTPVGGPEVVVEQVDFPSWTKRAGGI